ncbi:hypothetical protein BBG47_18490 [Paenibacillus sp. KS1]|nr:hypothetical protein BBG47_18490 [Paenibacillus sp. KS1]
MLSESAWKITRKYIHHEKPENWLFPGQEKKRHLTGKTVQKVFEEGEGQGCDSKNQLPSIRFSILLQRTYWKPVRIYDTFKSFLAITVREPRSIIHMLVKVELDAL